MAALSSLATGCCDSSTSATAIDRRGSLATSWSGLPRTASRGAEERFRGAVDPLHAAGAVRHDDRVVQRIDCGFGRLLRHQDFPRSD